MLTHQAGVGEMNVTPIRNNVCASICTTTDSSLCVGGILLGSASPCRDRFVIPWQHSADKLQVYGWLWTFLSVFQVSCFFFLLLFDSHSVSVSRPLLLFVFLPAGQYFSPCISMFPSFLSYSPPPVLTPIKWGRVESITRMRKQHLSTQGLLFWPGVFQL